MGLGQQRTVYCVIPVHNRLEVTKRCLEYLVAQDFSALRIVIVNDGSTDGTSDYLAQLGSSNLTVLNGDGSLWWGGAMNLGIDYVSKVAGEYDYLLMLNDDVRVNSDYVSTLIKESINHGKAVVGSTQRDEATDKVMGSGYHIDYWRMLMIVDTQAQGKSVDALPGRGVLFPMEAVLLAGNIKVNPFKHYLGDLEYSARVRELGWEIIISGQASVYTSADSSDSKVRRQGSIKEYFSSQSKNNLKHRLWFFSTRGPYWLRIWALPRYFFVGGYRLCRRLR